MALRSERAALTTQYEALRSAALGEPLPPMARYGLVLFLRRGMWAWARAQGEAAAPPLELALDRLREGRVTLTAVALLREHLTETNHADVLSWAEGRRKREVEEFIRALDPKPDVPSSLRRLPLARAVATSGLAADRPQGSRANGMSPSPEGAPGTAPVGANAPPSPPEPIGRLLAEVAYVRETATSPDPELPPAAFAEAATARPTATLREVSARDDRRAEIRPLAPARYSLHVTISQDTHDKLRRAQDLLQHAGVVDAALVLDRALTLLVAQLERKKAGASRQAERREVPPSRQNPNRPAARAELSSTSPQQRLEKTGRANETATRSRYIPAAVRRAVWDRDSGRCTYVSCSGVRCGATGSLEFHHRVPFAEGGASSVDNLSLACRLHNAWEAERWFNFDQTEFGVRESGNRRCPPVRNREDDPQGPPPKVPV